MPTSHSQCPLQVGSLRWLLEECCRRVPPQPEQIETLLTFGRSRAAAALDASAAGAGAAEGWDGDGWDGDDAMDGAEGGGAKFDVDAESIAEYSERRSS